MKNLISLVLCLFVLCGAAHISQARAHDDEIVKLQTISNTSNSSGDKAKEANDSTLTTVPGTSDEIKDANAESSSCLPYKIVMGILIAFSILSICCCCGVLYALSKIQVWR